MKVQNTITFIVSRNYGHPLSFSLPVWRLYVAGCAFLVLAAGMILLSSMYILSSSGFHQLERDYQKLQEERDSLREQVTSIHLRLFQAKEELLLAGLNQGAAPEVGIEGDGGYGSDLYVPPMRIDSYTTRVNGKSVEISFRVVHQGDAKNTSGGFLFAIFENEEKTPSTFVATPRVKTNEEGFPQTYKSGTYFGRVKRAATLRRRLKRKSLEEFFTHVTLYMFSVRGGLMLKERYPLDKDLFFKKVPVTKTQKTSNI